LQTAERAALLAAPRINSSSGAGGGGGGAGGGLGTVAVFDNIYFV